LKLFHTDPNYQTQTKPSLHKTSTPQLFINTEEVYCIGGEARDEKSQVVYSVTEVYDIVANSWSTVASFPVNRTGLQAYVVNEKIFVRDGRDLYMYDPLTDLWTGKARMPGGSPSFSVSFVVDDKLVVISDFFKGHQTLGNQKVRFYDLNTDKWSEGAEPPFEVSIGVAVVTTGLYAPQKVYILGATDFSFSPGVFYNRVYDPAGDTWSTATMSIIPRSAFGVAVVDDVLYIIGGGYGGSSTLSLTEQYVPIGYDPRGYQTLPTATPPVASDVTSSPIPSEPTPFRALLTQLVVVATVLTVGVVTAFFLYVRGRKRNKGNSEYE
jgi:N-acetylneuraminic acid mutarotase